MLHFNSHRIVLPRLIEWGLIDLTHWSRQDMLLFDLLVVLASGVLLWSSVRRSLHASRLQMVLLIPLSLVYLSFAQYENWFGPWQLTFLLTVFGVMLTLRAVHDSPGKLSGWRGFALGVAGAVIASLSAFGGLAVWVAFLPIVAWPRPQRGLRIALWSASALAVVVPYMIGYPRQNMQLSASTLFHLTGFILAGIGGPITPPNALSDAALAKLVGALGFALLAVVLYIYYRLHRSLDGLVVWLCLALYSLLTTASIGIGRLVGGTTQALDSRYQAFSGLWWIALLVMGAITLHEVLANPTEAQRLIPNVTSHNVLLRGAGLATVLLCVGCLTASVYGFQKQQAWTNAKLAQEQCILATDPPTDSCLAPFFLVGFVPISNQDLVAYIKQKRLALYAGKDVQAQGSAIPAAHLVAGPGGRR
jgi:hypothetical protein